MRLFIILFLSLPFIGNAQSVRVTVTQSFKLNGLKQADAGAKVYLLKYEGDAIGQVEKINNFLSAKYYRLLNNDVGRLITILKDSASVIKGRRIYEKEYANFQNRIADIKSAAAERNQKLLVLNAETNAKFDALDQESAEAITQLKLKAGEMRSVADAAGYCNIPASAGNYGVLIISNNRAGFSTSEVSGKIFLKQTELKEGEKMNVSTHFIPD